MFNHKFLAIIYIYARKSSIIIINADEQDPIDKVTRFGGINFNPTKVMCSTIEYSMQTKTIYIYIKDDDPNIYSAGKTIFIHGNGKDIGDLVFKFSMTLKDLSIWLFKNVRLGKLYLANLKKLSITETGLKKIDTSWQLPNLERLDLSGNEITKIPIDFRLPKLCELSLNRNKLTKIPALKCNTLNSLWLRNNKITIIHPKLNLPMLEVLLLNNNKINSIPMTVNMPKLIHFRIDPNDFIESGPPNIMSAIFVGPL